MGGDGVGDVHIGACPYAMLLNPVGVTKKADASASTLCLFVYMHGSCCHVPTCQRTCLPDTRMPGTCPLAGVAITIRYSMLLMIICVKTVSG